MAQTAETAATQQNASNTYYKWRNNNYMLSKSEEETKWHEHLADYWLSAWQILMAPYHTTLTKQLWKQLA